jgi:transcriptional regulator with XRE-family HTH domain
LRKKNKITQEALAIKIGVERSSIGKYESTETVPSPGILTEIARYFDCTIDYLLGITDKPNRILAPPELAELGFEWIPIVKKARAAGLTPEEMNKLIDAVKSLKVDNKR